MHLCPTVHTSFDAYSMTLDPFPSLLFVPIRTVMSDSLLELSRYSSGLYGFHRIPSPMLMYSISRYLDYKSLELKSARWFVPPFLSYSSSDLRLSRWRRTLDPFGNSFLNQISNGTSWEILMKFFSNEWSPFGLLSSLVLLWLWYQARRLLSIYFCLLFRIFCLFAI